MRSRFLLILCVVVSMAGLSHAQPLADRVPGDAVVYIGWSGSGAMGPEYDTSHLKGVLDASDAPKLFTDFLPKIFAAIGERDRDARKMSEMLSAIAAPMWRHPTAVYVGGVQWPDKGPPMPKFAVICDAGAEAVALEAKLKSALADLGESPFPIAVQQENGLVRLVVGYLPMDGPKITDNDKFKSALSKVNAKPVAVVYVDGEALVKQIDTAVERGNDRQAQREWPRIRQATGIEGFKAGIWTAAFEDRNWSTRAYIAAPAPRTGVLKFLDNQPLPDDTLKVVPQGAILAAAGRMDLGKAFDSLRELVATLDKRAGRDLDNGVKQINDKLGMDLRSDVLSSIGDTWVYYVDPMTGGNGILGGVIVNKLPDAEKAQKAFTSLEKALNSLLADLGRREAMHAAFKTATLDGVEVHYLAIPIVTPAWTIKNGQWLIGFYPQTVLAAAKHLEAAGKSLLDNPAYVELRKKFGDVPAAGINYMDLPRLAPNGYATWLMLTRYAGIGDMFGIDSPLMILPPMYKLQEHLAASGAVTWTTEDGVYYRAVSPFPGSNLIAADPLSTMGVVPPIMLGSILSMGFREAEWHPMVPEQ